MLAATTSIFLGGFSMLKSEAQYLAVWCVCVGGVLVGGCCCVVAQRVDTHQLHVSVAEYGFFGRCQVHGITHVPEPCITTRELTSECRCHNLPPQLTLSPPCWQHGATHPSPGLPECAGGQRTVVGSRAVSEVMDDISANAALTPVTRLCMRGSWTSASRSSSTSLPSDTASNRSPARLCMCSWYNRAQHAVAAGGQLEAGLSCVVYFHCPLTVAASRRAVLSPMPGMLLMGSSRSSK